MAFVTPVNRSLAELINPAIWNQDVVANTLAMGPHLIVRKASDESVTSSITQQPDNDLILPVGINEVWQYEFMVLAEGAFDINFGFTFPSGTVSWLLLGANSASTVSMLGNATSSSPASVGGVNVNNSPNYVPVFINGVYVNGGTGGSLTLTWAQLSSGATATTVKANSTLWAVKLA